MHAVRKDVVDAEAGLGLWRLLASFVRCLLQLVNAMLGHSLPPVMRAVRKDVVDAEVRAATKGPVARRNAAEVPSRACATQALAHHRVFILERALQHVRL